MKKKIIDFESIVPLKIPLKKLLEKIREKRNIIAIRCRNKKRDEIGKKKIQKEPKA